MSNQPVALITGCNGFVGKWLTEYLNKLNYSIFGIDNHPTPKESPLNYKGLDILDTDNLSELIAEIKPQMIFHLAGVSYLPDADKSPVRSVEINILGTLSLFEAVKNSNPSSKILFVGSSKEYNQINSTPQIAETVTPVPNNFYGITKYTGELLGLQYVNQFGMKIYFTRSFNHTGPGQSPLFVCSDWAKQVALIDQGCSNPTLLVGDTNAVIDFTDVRDVVDAYYKILQDGIPGEVYNVCSSKGHSLDWILNHLRNKTSKHIIIQEEIQKKRSHSTNKLLLGDNTKLKNHTGWQCTIPMEKTLDDIYSYWIENIRSSTIKS